MISKQTNHKNTVKRFMNMSVFMLDLKTTHYDLDNFKFCEGFNLNNWGEKNYYLLNLSNLNGNSGV
jgi:hypothetical protein